MLCPKRSSGFWAWVTGTKQNAVHFVEENKPKKEVEQVRTYDLRPTKRVKYVYESEDEDYERL